jgi:hypothetical protein
MKQGCTKMDSTHRCWLAVQFTICFQRASGFKLLDCPTACPKYKRLQVSWQQHQCSSSSSRDKSRSSMLDCLAATATACPTCKRLQVSWQQQQQHCDGCSNRGISHQQQWQQEEELG